MIIDFHTHIFPAAIRNDRERFFRGEPAFKLLYESAKSPLAGARQLVAGMDQHGVDRSVVFGFPWRSAETIHLHNDYIIDAVNRYPNRLIGFCCFDMAYAGAAAETERCLNQGLAGVGELAAYQGEIDDAILKNIEPVAQLCIQRNVPLLLHANEPVGHTYPGKSLDSLPGVYRFVQRFPKTTIVLAHWGGGLFFYTLLKKEVTEALANVYFDTAASPFLYHPQIFEIAKELIGVDKLLFGSDYPLLSPGRYFKELASTALTADEISRVKGTTAAGLLNLNVT